MTTLIERNEGHYKAHELPYGKDYVWCPRCVLLECDCGERVVLSPSNSSCECGRDHATLVREELATRRPEGSADAPWREEHREWLEGEWRHTEYDYWLELSTIE